MTENDNNGDELFASAVEDRSIIRCPRCDREESFESELMAYTWLAGHFEEAHPDELPPL